MGVAVAARALDVLPTPGVAALAVLGAWLTMRTALAPTAPATRRGARVTRAIPVALGGLVALAGLAEVASTLAHPGMAGPGPLGLPADPSATHALAFPAGLLLLMSGAQLALRRRGAWLIAAGLLMGTGVIALLRGDMDGAVLTWTVAGLLVWARDAFAVPHRPDALRRALTRLPVVALAALGTSLAAVMASARHVTPQPTPGLILRTALDLLTFQPAPLTFQHPFGWVPSGVALTCVAALAAIAWPVVRPLAHPFTPPGERARRRAGELVRTFGDDTLSFFKLRSDLQYRFSADHSAFVGYRVRHGVLVVSGDPVGEAAAFPDLLDDVRAFAAHHGLGLAVLGAGGRLRPLYEAAGLRAVYLGDEAIVTTGTFTLEGRAVRKVRQSVTRLRRAGYTVTLMRAGALDADTLASLEAVSARWRGTAPERGFCMSMDRLDGRAHPDCLVLVARDADGVPRGFLHLVPCAGGRRMSLSLMRRDRDTPNGLTEFMVTQAIALLRERGLEEVSLNFATFGRFLRDPRSRVERIAGRVVRTADRWFQIVRLLRFNEKFSPRWQARYLMVDGWPGMPRAGIAAMALEGHLPTFRRRVAPASAETDRGGRIVNA